MKSRVILAITIVTFLLIASVKCFSQTDTSIVKFKNTLSVWSSKGYSQASIIDLGNSKMIIISGQVSLDSNGNLVGKSDLGKQAEQVFSNIKSILVAAGGTMDNLVKIGIFMVDISQLPTLREVRNKFININYPPASTLVEVSKLFRDDVLLEVEATAIIPKK